MFLYLLCGLSLSLLSQTPSFAHESITSDTHYFSTRDVISSEEKVSKDGEFKSAGPACTISQHHHPNNKGDSFHVFIAVFLKQLAILNFRLRSPPTLSS
jgi:hypothetical protein